VEDRQETGTDLNRDDLFKKFKALKSPGVGIPRTSTFAGIPMQHQTEPLLQVGTQYATSHTNSSKLVDWEINVPFQHKNRLSWGQGLGRRFSSARLKMANDTRMQ